MNRPQPRPAAPTRRTVVLAGAGTAAALLTPAFTRSAEAAPAASAEAASRPFASYWFPDSLPTGIPGDGVTWRDPRHYELHRILPDGTRRFLGGTCGTAFFVPDIQREPGEKAARFQVRAVGELYTTSGAASTAHRW
ncbi:hypothetical protein ACIBO4_07295 [Streptomyces sp. NPDC050149]|uniref:GH85 family endohexosaminidase C-terminal domain-containing protein n=1 Tax=Streptomyces sp. NPDC050149 TaxID=3365603 RepID=UPI0037B7CE0B